MKTFAIFTTMLFLGFSSNGNDKIEDGNPSDCVRMARTATLTVADLMGQDPNGENFDGYLRLYMELYEACLES